MLRSQLASYLKVYIPMMKGVSYMYVYTLVV